ncbi:MAG: hypothetical protein ACR2K1_12790 [Saprospiraceae bacterium]
MDNRTSVKIENADYEQIYKLGDEERFQNPENVRKLLEAGILDHAALIFREMHQQKLAALSKLFPPEIEESFETII